MRATANNGAVYMTITKEMEDYQNLPTTNNLQWAAGRMMNELTDEEFEALHDSLHKLNVILYKSWAKELTLEELIIAVKDVNVCQNRNLSASHGK